MPPTNGRAAVPLPRALAAATCAAMALLAAVYAQVPPPPAAGPPIVAAPPLGTAPAAPSAAAVPPARAGVASPPQRPAPARIAQASADISGPRWGELTAGQKQSLGPLAGTWDTMTEGHKRKWLVLSQNYPTLPAAEKALMHSRMTEWAGLTPQQRIQARLNFAETKKLAGHDRQARWEEYQALPPEEKRKLAAGAAVKPPPTAAAAQPVPAQKLVRVPKPPRPDTQARQARTPRIAVAPGQVDSNTLLPYPGAAAGP